MNIGAFTLAPARLVVNGHKSLEEWEQSARVLFDIQRSVYWWIGDMIVFGEQQFGDELYQVADDTVSVDMINRCVSVSREFPPNERHQALSWTHHQLVVPYKKPMQQALLKKAEDNKWSTQQFREYLSRVRQ